MVNNDWGPQTNKDRSAFLCFDMRMRERFVFCDILCFCSLFFFFSFFTSQKKSTHHQRNGLTCFACEAKVALENLNVGSSRVSKSNILEFYVSLNTFRLRSLLVGIDERLTVNQLKSVDGGVLGFLKGGGEC